MNKVRWGVLSTAKIGREKVIPALQKATHCEVVAIASRSEAQAKSVSAQLHVPKAYGSYEELLADKNIDAVYIPLPNHLHVDWAIKAIEAGKHVLCEKPIGVSTADAERLLQAAALAPERKVMEAFMYRFHPQWQAVKKMVDEKRIGEIKTIQSFFSYHNVDEANIRNQKEAAGGALMDIGCYCVSWSRLLFGSEPQSVFGAVENDPQFGTDRLTSGLLQFPSGTSLFTCATQLMPYQRVNILGSEGRIEIEVPVNAPPDKAAKVWLHQKSGTEELLFDAVDQYTLQGDAFSAAVLNGTEVPVSLQDAVNNMRVIDAVFRSAEEKRPVNF